MGSISVQVCHWTDCGEGGRFPYSSGSCHPFRRKGEAKQAVNLNAIAPHRWFNGALLARPVGDWPDFRPGQLSNQDPSPLVEESGLVSAHRIGAWRREHEAWIRHGLHQVPPCVAGSGKRTDGSWTEADKVRLSPLGEWHSLHSQCLPRKSAVFLVVLKTGRRSKGAGSPSGIESESQGLRIERSCFQSADQLQSCKVLDSARVLRSQANTNFYDSCIDIRAGIG